MLFLQHSADGSAPDTSPRVPVDETTAGSLELALLSNDNACRLRELEATLSTDSNLANWALRTAELRLSRTVNRVEEAAHWLSEHLVTELAATLVADPPASPADGVVWRLPSLVRLLSEVDRQQADFHARLEREKRDAMKELAYGASHEINNPLANIAARAQTLLEGEEDPQRQQKLQAIHRQAMRAHEMIADLMLFGRPPKLSPALFDLQQLVRQVVNDLTDLALEHQVQLTRTGDDNCLEVVADETQLAVAVHAVVKNAIEAVSEGGHVTVELRDVATGESSSAEIVVRDDGPGISDEVRRHMFDPFYSGREAGRGLGFGLSKCWRIVSDHGGQVIVQQPAGRGAEISILLPSSIVAQKPTAQNR